MNIRGLKKSLIKSLNNEFVFSILAVFGYFLQGRFWIFKDFYKNLDNHIGSYSDAYYVMGVYLQNGLNFLNGSFYSLQGDHYVWYGNIIAATEHTAGVSLVYSLFFELTKNPTLSFNLLYALNIILLQFGFYLLLKHFTKNRILSFLGGFFLPLSHALKMYYVGHIHSVMYWPLPFMVLMIEKYFLIDTKRNILTQSIVYLFTLFCFIWLLLAGWHIAIFSSIFLISYTAIRAKRILSLFKTSKIKLFQLVSIALIGLLALTPIAIETLNASSLYRKTRSEADVSFESRAITNLYSLQNPTLIALTTIKDQELIKLSDQDQEKTLDLLKGINANSNNEPFPDLVSSFSFYIYFILLIPYIIYLISKRRPPHNLFYVYTFSIFMFVLAMGPYLKFPTKTFEGIKMPHYYIYQIFYPIQAIRNINRSMFIGYFSLLIFLTLTLSKIFNYLKSKKFFNKAYSIFGVVSLLVLSIFVNFAWTGKAMPQIEIDNDLQEAYSIIHNDKTKSEVYFLDQYGKDKFNNDSLGYNTSIFNFNKKVRAISLVNGSIAGLYPYSILLDTLEDSTVLSQKQLFSEVLAGKKVDYIVAKNRSLSGGIIDSLLSYYSIDFENETYKVLSLNDNITLETSSEPDISLTIPSHINKDVENFAYINFGNLSDKVWINKDVVLPVEYKITFSNNSKNDYSINEKFGEEPFLVPNDGFTVESQINTDNLNPGEYEVTLYREDERIQTKYIEVYDDEPWKEKFRTDEFEAGFQKFTDTQYGNYLGINSFYSKGKVTSGAIVEPINISPKYENLEGEAYPGFPAWLEQFECQVKGSYTEGDLINKWCSYHETGGLEYNIISGELSK